MDMAAKAAGLAIVFGLLALWAFLMRRAGAKWTLRLGRAASSTRASLRSEVTLALSPQHRLHVIEWEQRRFLLLTFPSGGVVVDPGAHASFLPAFAEALVTTQNKPGGQA